jgi:ABC-type uncharacterized transport system substrate-binding protein
LRRSSAIAGNGGRRRALFHKRKFQVCVSTATPQNEHTASMAPIVKQATASIPIVVVVGNDPVASGLVASLARAGGNVTGVTYVHDQLAGKTIELLRDAAPWVSRVAILWNPNHTDPEFRETQRAAQALQIQFQSLEVGQPGDFEGAFQAATRERAEALIVVGSRIMFLHRKRIGDFAAKNRLILIGTPKWLSGVGATLLTYGPNPAEMHRRAASYVSPRPAAGSFGQADRRPLALELALARSRSSSCLIEQPARSGRS